jgi:choline monooxygenase
MARFPHDFDPRLPLAEARTIPSNWYHEAEIAEAERRNVFGNSWQLVGRVEQVMQPGQFLTAEIAGEPVMVVRGDDHILRALYNVCRHRAAPLLTDPCGEATKLRCRYHGWTYDLTGALRGTPEFAGVQNFCKEDHGLVPIPVATWGPFVFVHLGESPTPADTVLSPLATWANRVNPFDRLNWHSRRTYDVECNWKVYVDNYLDGGYHVNTVHPALAGAIHYQEYRTDLFEFCSLQSTPLVPTEGDVGATRTGEAAYWWIYPNWMLNHYSGVMDTNLVLPLGPTRCRVIFDFYFPSSWSAEQRAQSMDVAEQVQREDIEISEQVQRGLGSRSYTTGRFSVLREAGGYHFHRLLAEHLQ